ncbi:MAG: hypothetical protein ACLSEF_15195 [Faecalibacterium prausnitzii]
MRDFLCSLLSGYFLFLAGARGGLFNKDARYETYHYFKERNTEIQTVLANVDSILEMEKLQQREQRPRAKKRSYDMSL